MKQLKLFISAGVLSFLFIQKTYAHCEVPCGIYEDSVRIVMIYEHITTIEKSMKKIVELSKSETINYNQLIRWVNNKEEHANKLQEIVNQYFMTQRIKPVEKLDEHNYSHYIEQLTFAHQLLVLAMKAKQTTELAYVGKLKNTVANFEAAYFHKH